MKEIRSIEDLELATLKPGDKVIFKKGLMLLPFTVELNVYGWYLINKEDIDIFNVLALEDTHKEDFVENVMGYCGKGEFPVCEDALDLKNLVKALFKETDLQFNRPGKKVKTQIYNKIDRVNILEVGIKVYFTVDKRVIKYEVRKVPRGYYLKSLTGEGNHILFTILKLEKQVFTRKTIGYYNDGEFPFTESIEDLVTLINALYDYIQRTKSGSFPDNTNHKKESNGRTIEIRRITATVRKGRAKRGNPVSGKTIKITTSSGHLRNRKVSR